MARRVGARLEKRTRCVSIDRRESGRGQQCRLDYGSDARVAAVMRMRVMVPRLRRQKSIYINDDVNDPSPKTKRCEVDGTRITEDVLRWRPYEVQRTMAPG
mmetsp:Transcript_23471/g.50703  ORF Transcript_23471/g.50703 Transcript_23471/m.50703 type:complete len:101 (+) Transcript_23471:1056-1358(+)